MPINPKSVNVSIVVVVVGSVVIIIFSTLGSIDREG